MRIRKSLGERSRSWLGVLAFGWLLANSSPAGAQTVTFIYSFTGGTNDGAHPLGTPASSGDTLFGIGTTGGSNNQGVVFSISTNGGNFQILHSFTGVGADGCCPDGSVILAGDTLYGTAGFPRSGSIFSIATNGADFQTLHPFEGGDNDGAGPFQSTALVLVDDTLYGVTDNGGTNNDGVVYSITTNGANFQLLYSFTGGADGLQPNSSLTPVGETLFGMTAIGGSNDAGVIYSVSTNGTGFQVLHTFTGGADGGRPGGALTLVNGTLFGLTSAGGGSHSNGTLFTINTDGSDFHVVRSFGSIGNDAIDPETTLALVGDTLYATSSAGGEKSDGTIFSIGTNGLDYGIVYSFGTTNNTDSAPGPNSSLAMVGSNLFGFTYNGGASSLGTIFTLDLGAGGSIPVSSNLVAFSFSNVVQTCKFKSKFDKSTMETNTTTNCTLSVDFVVTNGGATNTPAFYVLLWAEEGVSFVDNGDYLVKKVKALKEGKSDTIKVKGKFNASQAGSFIYATDTNLNVIASVEVPAPE